LQKYELSPEEWEIVKELRNVLKDTTLFFSCGTPNLATVILAMDHIDKVLTMTSDNSHQFSLPIRAALIIGKNTINWYYNKTDHLEVYRIAMILHPQHKLAYFKTQGWEELWIETAQNLVCEQFD
ncbi:hypothetical protein EDB92DRAFT_1756262, partial [Lactarius akahatsu]